MARETALLKLGWLLGWLIAGALVTASSAGCHASFTSRTFLRCVLRLVGARQVVIAKNIFVVEVIIVVLVLTLASGLIIPEESPFGIPVCEK